ncbi:hypothetical protein MHU86_8103 [Fragilaria crotonensis]|nr:hypothetical protein MHU86_8103 [Fragilaria crotonensis]
MQHTIKAKEREKLQEKIGDSKCQSEVDDNFFGLFLSIKEVQEAERDAEDDIEPLEPESARKDADDYKPESMDKFILPSCMLLPHGEDVNEFPDGSTATYAANVIAENLYSQVDDEGWCHFAILHEITDHKKDGSALSKDDGFIENRHGQRRPKLTMTRGWKFGLWKDGSGLDSVKGREGSESRQGGRVCSFQQNCRRTCICLVDARCTAPPAGSCNQEGKVHQVLTAVAQEWHCTAKDSGESAGDRSQKGDYLMARRH